MYSVIHCMNQNFISEKFKLYPFSPLKGLNKRKYCGYLPPPQRHLLINLFMLWNDNHNWNFFSCSRLEKKLNDRNIKIYFSSEIFTIWNAWNILIHPGRIILPEVCMPNSLLCVHLILASYTNPLLFIFCNMILNIYVFDNSFVLLKYSDLVSSLFCR